MAWAKNGTPDTLSSSADVVSIADLTGKIFNVFLNHSLTDGGVIDNRATFNNSTGSEYARRRSENGAADFTAVSQTVMNLGAGGGAADKFVMTYVVVISGVVSSKVALKKWSPFPKKY